MYIMFLSYIQPSNKLRTNITKSPFEYSGSYEKYAKIKTLILNLYSIYLL